MNKLHRRPAAIGAVLVLVGSAVAVSTVHADIIPLSATEYADGTTTWPPGTPGSPLITSLSGAGAYAYSDTSLSPETSSGGLIAGSNYPATYPGASFYDAFAIDIPNADGSSISSTINLGSAYQISDFQERLYSYSGTAPTVGPVPGALDFWTTSINLAGVSGTVAELPTTYLSAGTYVLEIRGQVTGAIGGAYSGTLQLTPVPLPASLPLLLSTLGALGLGLARRRYSGGAPRIA